MASVSKETRGGRVTYRIAFVDPNGRRRFVRLPGVQKRDAQEVASRVDAIVSARMAGSSLPPSVVGWLSSLGDTLHAKLASAGLVEERKSATLGEFLEGFITRHAERLDPKTGSPPAPNTITNLRATQRRLVAYFGEDRDLGAITVAEAAAWQQALHRDYSPASVAAFTKKAKQAIGAAVEEGLLAESPFRKLVAGAIRNDDRRAYVDTDDVRLVIDQAPDADWRVLIALARFAGLRNPSETLALRWSDIDWSDGTMRVPSPKTKRHGKPYRVTPIFTELRPYLDEAYLAARDGAEFVVDRYRSADANLRTHFLRLIAKAGLDAWPRPWHGMRASCESDLASKYPLHVVTAWLGNTPKVAADHYLSVLPEHVATASGTASKSDRQALEGRSDRGPAEPMATPRGPARSSTGGGTVPPRNRRNPVLPAVPPSRENRGKHCVSRLFESAAVPPTGVEPVSPP